jgi:hypothetical protein
MDPKLFFGIVSSLVAIASLLPYFRDIFRGKTKPHTYSWLIWTILQVIGVSAQLQDGAGYGAWALAIAATGSFLIFTLSFKHGTKNITKFDGICLIGSLITLAIYVGMDNPLLAVILVVVIDFLAFLPTFRKGWEEPATETVSTFALSGLANFLGLFALEHYTIITTCYIASLFLTNATFVIMILYRKNISLRAVV